MLVLDWPGVTNATLLRSPVSPAQHPPDVSFICSPFGSVIVLSSSPELSSQISFGSSSIVQEIDAGEPRRLVKYVESAERNAILVALRLNNWDRGQSSKALGVSRVTLWTKMSALNFPSRPDESELGKCLKLQGQDVKAVSLREARERAEEAAVISALTACFWVRTHAAQMLGVCRLTLYNKMQKYGISTVRPSSISTSPTSGN